MYPAQNSSTGITSTAKTKIRVNIPPGLFGIVVAPGLGEKHPVQQLAQSHQQAHHDQCDDIGHGAIRAADRFRSGAARR